jgi:hypothetical protein
MPARPSLRDSETNAAIDTTVQLSRKQLTSACLGVAILTVASLLSGVGTFSLSYFNEAVPPCSKIDLGLYKPFSRPFPLELPCFQQP